MRKITIYLIILLTVSAAQAGKNELDLWYDGNPVATGATVNMMASSGLIGVASNVAQPYSDGGGLYIILSRNGTTLPGSAVMSNEGVIKYPECDPDNCSVYVYPSPQENTCWFHNPVGSVQAGLQFEVPVTMVQKGLIKCEIGYYNPGWHVVDSMLINLSDEQNLDFEMGSYIGWTTTGTAWGSGPVNDNGGHSNIFDWQGTWYANSYPAGEGATGTLKSVIFELEGDIDFLIAGHSYWPGQEPQYSHNYVSLKLANGVEIERVWAPGQDSFVPAKLKANGHQGKKVYIEVVDNGSASMFSWMAVDGFRLGNEDIDENGKVSLSDLEIVTDQWLTDGFGYDYLADLNNDEFIDFADFSIIGTSWNNLYPISYNFCSGSLGNWTKQGTAFGISTRANSGAECGYHVESLVGGESATGKLISPTFYISDDYLLFLASGWNGFNGHTQENGYRLRRASDDAILRQEYPPNTDSFRLKIMDVKDLVGQEVYFEVYDNDTQTGWAWLGLDKLWSYTPSDAGTWKPDMFVIGIGWPTVNFIAEANRAQYLQNLANLNLNLLMLEDGMPEFAESYGMKAMIYQRPTPPDLVYKYKDNPLTWGYFQWDEPKSDKFQELATYHQDASFIDPLKPSYTNLQSINYGISRQNVLDFVSIVKPEILSFDFYHWYWYTFWNGYPTLIENLDFFREVAINNNIPLYSWVEVDAASSGGMENLERYHYSVYMNLVYGVKGILWFNAAEIFDCADAATIPNSGAIENQGYYNDVQAINAELKNIGPELIALDSVAVYHNGIGQRSGDHSASMDPIPSGYWIQILTNGMTLGMFKNDAGQDYAMVMNRDKDYGNTVRVQFGEQVSQVMLFDEQTATWSELSITGAVGSQEVSFFIGGGYGKLLRITK